MLCFGRRASTTSCFALVVVVRCFGDVVLCFVRRRRTSCFASTTRSAFRSRSGLLCAIRHAKYAASVSKFPCCVCPCLCSPSASLPCLEKEVLAFSFCCSFLAGRPRRTQRTGTPTAYIRCAFFYLLLVALQAQQPKKIARFAPLCAPRAINSTPGGGARPICTNKCT